MHFKIIIILANIFISNGEQKVSDYILDVFLTAKELIIRNGYPYEDYTVQTADGYLLSLQRIPHGRQSLNQTTSKNKPILLMPGLFSDCSIYVNMGKQNSLAFILADHGYDVWLGNYRGSTLSRKHVSLNPDVDRKKYWDYSYHEIGYYDVPAFIEHILKVTNREKLFYFGHSQGATSYLILLSELPQYAKKIQYAVLMAPAMVTTHTSSPIFLFVEKYLQLIKDYSDTNEAYELLPSSRTFSVIVVVLCNENSPLVHMCANAIKFVHGWSHGQINLKRIPVEFSNIPSGSSIRQMFHFYQAKSGKFRQYDFGKKENLKKYGAKKPPYYNVTNATPPTGIYHGDCDLVTDPTDVKYLAYKLPNLFKRRMYADFNHLDVVWGKDASKTVFDDVLKDLKLHI